MPKFNPKVGFLIQEFFCKRLIQLQNVSANTVASYRDTFRLLLRYLQKCKRKNPADVELSDLDAPTVMAFLDDLENSRRNGVRTRNSRLAALRSFMKYAVVLDPTTLSIAQRVLAIPMKRFNRRIVGHLTPEEVTAVVNAPDATTWSGRRDQALLAVMYNTGTRVSEVIGLCRKDVSLDALRAIHVCGKGRKQRQVPLWKSTSALLVRWLSEIPPTPNTPLFPNRFGQPMSRSGIEDRLDKAVTIAAKHCKSLVQKRVSPHTLRHSTAMHLLQSGVEITVIALWLGHENTETTNQYLEADLAMKQRALDKMAELPTRKTRYRAEGDLLTFLDGL